MANVPHAQLATLMESERQAHLYSHAVGLQTLVALDRGWNVHDGPPPMEYAVMLYRHRLPLSCLATGHFCESLHSQTLYMTVTGNVFMGQQYPSQSK